MKVLTRLKTLVLVVSSFCLLTGCTSKGDIEETVKHLLPEALQGNAALMEMVSIKNVDSCTLVKESGNKYNGIANVNLLVKKSGKTLMVTYDLKVISDGETVLIDGAEMEDQYLTKLLTLAGVSEDE